MSTQETQRKKERLLKMSEENLDESVEDWKNTMDRCHTVSGISSGREERK